MFPQNSNPYLGKMKEPKITFIIHSTFKEEG
jgi:hypothetical protein